MCADRLLGIGIAIRPHAGGHVGGVDAGYGLAALNLIGELDPLQWQIRRVGASMDDAEQRADGVGRNAPGAADVGARRHQSHLPKLISLANRSLAFRRQPSSRPVSLDHVQVAVTPATLSVLV